MPAINTNISSLLASNTSSTMKTSASPANRFSQLLTKSAVHRRVDPPTPMKTVKAPKPAKDQTPTGDEDVDNSVDDRNESSDASNDASTAGQTREKAVSKPGDCKKPAKAKGDRDEATSDVDATTDETSETTVDGNVAAAADDGDASTSESLADGDGSDADLDVASHVDELNTELAMSATVPPSTTPTPTDAAASEGSTGDAAEPTAAVATVALETSDGQDADNPKLSASSNSEIDGEDAGAASNEASIASQANSIEADDEELAAKPNTTSTKQTASSTAKKQHSLKPGEMRPVPQGTDPSQLQSNPAAVLSPTTVTTANGSSDAAATPIETDAVATRPKSSGAVDTILDPSQMLNPDKPAEHAPASSSFAAHLGATNNADVTANNHDKIVQVIKSDLTPNGGSMRIRLDPPELGALQVTVKMTDGVMTASFETSNDQASKMLSNSLSQLKTALESSGVSVEKLHVQQAPKDSSSNNNTGNDDSRREQMRGSDEGSQQQRDQQRKEMIRRMWAKLGVGDPLDLVA